MSTSNLQQIIITPYDELRALLGSNDKEGTYQDAISDMIETLDSSLDGLPAKIQGAYQSLIPAVLAEAATTIDPYNLVVALRKRVSVIAHEWLVRTARMRLPMQEDYSLILRFLDNPVLVAQMRRGLKGQLSRNVNITRFSPDTASCILLADGTYTLAFGATIHGLTGTYVNRGNILNDQLLEPN